MTPSHLCPVRAYFLVLASMVSAGRFCGVCTVHGIQRGRPVMAVPHLTPPHTSSHLLTIRALALLFFSFLRYLS